MATKLEYQSKEEQKYGHRVLNLKKIKIVPLSILRKRIALRKEKNKKDMLDSLHIQNYRLFKDLKIEKLGQVNLISGKNNCGKTALLEAIRILQNKLRLDIIENIVALRGDLDENKPYESIISIFPDNELSFVINEAQWNIQKLSDGAVQYHIGPTKSVSLRSQMIQFNNYHNPIDETIYVPFKQDKELKIRTDFWEKIIFSKEEKQKVVDTLNIISNIKIHDIAMLDSMPILQLENNDVVKLSRWGDGANRLLIIALALVNAKNKTLLIDEFEVGLHHGIQKELWEIIFKYAKEWNIQVFITTHSMDTVRTFSYVLDNYPDLGQYMRLQKSKMTGEIEVLIYTQRSLDISIEENFETR